MLKRIFCIILIIIKFNAVAAIAVSPMIIDLNSKQPGSEIAVRNLDSKNIAYVEITAYTLLNPGLKNAAKHRAYNPDKDGLLVFPSKVVLQPGQTQFVRVQSSLKSPDRDKVYEIDVVPKVVTHLENDKPQGNSDFGIRVVVGYGVRVTIRPDSAKPSIDAKIKNNTLVIKNNGNTSARITSCTQTKAGKKVEIPLPAYTIFSGQKIQTSLTNASVVTINLSVQNRLLRPVKAV